MNEYLKKLNKLFDFFFTPKDLLFFFLSKGFSGFPILNNIFPSAPQETVRLCFEINFFLKCQPLSFSIGKDFFF